jgi:alcohol dehydrogenase class IV
MNQLSIPGSAFMMKSEEFCESMLKELKGKNILLFMTSSSAKRLSLESWITNLRVASSLIWINKITSNPTYIDVYEALSIIKGKKPEAVIAIGGGSTIDMAKACVGLNYLSEKEELKKNDVLECIKTKEYLDNPTNIPIFAIPTTAGTGSEVTRWATVWDLEGGAKYSVDAPYLYPKKAYIIPEYTVSMPKRLTLSTGLDALCQAVEAYWAKATNPMVKELSKVAIRLIVEYLPKVIEDTTNLYYREKVFLGSLFSGMAFSNTRTTACHSISYPLTMKFGIEHGLACIISLPKVMEINLPAIAEVEELFKALGVKNTGELQNWLDALTGDIVDLRLSSFGIEGNDIEELVNMSFTLGRMDNNPIPITKDDVKKILESIM